MDGSPLLLAFGLTLAMSFLVGLALREYFVAQEHVDYFGSVRTYTFIGMLGFGLHQLDSDVAYAAGLAALAAFLTVYYWRKSAAGKQGMIGMLTALLTQRGCSVAGFFSCSDSWCASLAHTSLDPCQRGGALRFYDSTCNQRWQVRALNNGRSV